MAIQHRRGAYSNFDASRMKPAELAVVTSGAPNTGKAVYVAFSAGNVKKLATVEDIETELESAVQGVADVATAQAQAAATAAQTAQAAAESAASGISSSLTQISTNTQDIADIKDELENLDVETDATLTQQGKPADAKATGDAISALNESLGNMQNATDGDVGKALMVKTVEDGKVTEWDFVKAGDPTVSIEESGSEITVDISQDSLDELKAVLTYTQEGAASVSPSTPVPIAGVKNVTLTVNGTSHSASFTSLNSNGIGKGTWDIINGVLIEENPIVTITSDMVASKVTASSFAQLNIGIPYNIDKGGVLACSHYKPNVSGNTRISLVGGNNVICIYDPNLANLSLAEAKTYLANMGIQVVLDAKTPISYNVTPISVSLIDGSNTLSISDGEVVLKYSVDILPYIDSTMEVAQTALQGVSTVSSEIDDVKSELYKHEDITIRHTGTGTAASSATINWGIRIPYTIGEEENWTISVIPQFTTQDGTYTATRYKKTGSGATLTSGDEVEVVETKTVEKGSAVAFDKIGNDEIITIVASSGQTQRSTDVAGKIDVAMGHVNPQTGVYTSFSGQLSGEYTLTKYKPISSGSLPLFGKNITLIGDSITEKTGRAAVTHGQYLERWTGCNVQNLGVSSTGFSTNNKYKSRISSVNADVDIIGVAASFNDMRNSVGTASDTASDETVCGYANEFFDLLLTSFPAASIVCYSEGAWESYRPGVEKSDTYMTEMEKICKSKGIAWDCSLYNGCALRPWIEANRNIYYVGEEGQYEDVVDNIHPNSAGQKIIANYLRCLFEKYLTGLD